MKPLKKNFPLVTSLLLLIIGVLGMAGVRFFSANAVLLIIEIAAGMAGLIFFFRKI